MMKYFRPRRIDRFGAQLVTLQQRLNTGTLGAGTQTHSLGGLPRRAVVTGVTVAAKTYPTAATSCVVTLVKRDVSAAGNVTLSDAIDINAKTAETAINGTLLTTLTDAQLTLDPTDTLKVSLVTTGAVSVQPDDLDVTVELMVLD